jgi:hypothetical protein
MPELLIKFIVRLGGEPGFRGGPLFHRWLPDGEKDAISVKVEAGHLQVSFDRCGSVKEGSIVFDFDRREVDNTIVSRQGMLDGGPLFGRLRLSDISDQELEVLRHDEIGHPFYLKLAKRIVKSAFPAIAHLIALVRLRYGQHWLTAPEPWDSRHRSLGAFAVDWNMSWSEDGTTWRRFAPEKETRHYPFTNTKFDEYLTQSDWLAIKTSVEKGDAIPLTTELIMNGHRLLAEGEFRYAAIEAASALEVAVAQTVRGPLQGSKRTDELGGRISERYVPKDETRGHRSTHVSAN